MSIIRSEKGIDNPYTTVLRSPFEDERLSWEARGLLAYLLIKPDTWEIRLNDLIKRGPAGRDKIRRMIKELEQGYYLRRHKVFKDDGQIEWKSEVFEDPRLNPDFVSSNGFYQDYLKSPEWKAKAKDARKRAGYRCQLCSQKDDLQVHHNSYENLGNEADEDLIVLCCNCHGKFHGKIDQ